MNDDRKSTIPDASDTAVEAPPSKPKGAGLAAQIADMGPTIVAPSEFDEAVAPKVDPNVWPGAVPSPDLSLSILLGTAPNAAPELLAAAGVFRSSLGPATSRALTSGSDDFDDSVLRAAALTRFRLAVATRSKPTSQDEIDTDALGELLAEVDSVLELFQVPPDSDDPEVVAGFEEAKKDVASRGFDVAHSYEDVAEADQLDQHLEQLKAKSKAAGKRGAASRVQIPQRKLVPAPSTSREKNLLIGFLVIAVIASTLHIYRYVTRPDLGVEEPGDISAMPGGLALPNSMIGIEFPDGSIMVNTVNSRAPNALDLDLLEATATLSNKIVQVEEGGVMYILPKSLARPEDQERAEEPK